MLLGMSISADGDFQDEEQFKAFGQLIRDTFGTPIAITENGCTVTLPEKRKVKYVVIREDITGGQRIRGFCILADGIPVCESECIGHKRIVPFENLEASEIMLEITKQAGNAKVRDIAIY